MSFSGGQILNVNELDHWPMPRDVSLKYAKLLRNCGRVCGVHVSHLIGRNDRAVSQSCHGDAFARRKVPCAHGLGRLDAEREL